MKTGIFLRVASLGLFVFAGLATADILTGTVSFNPATDRFTYSYTLNNTAGPSAIDELSILVDRSVQDFGLMPAAHTDPPGTNFFVAVSGLSALPPVNESGTFWGWEVSVPVGTILSGFSFSTAAPPVLSSAHNYFLFGADFEGGPPGFEGLIEFGHIVGPDLGLVAVPEPGAGSLLLFVIAFLAGLRKFRNAKASRLPCGSGS